MRGPTALQRLALQLIASGETEAPRLADEVGVAGGYDNHAVFIMRLLDRGWVELKLTAEGERALGE